MSGLVRTPGVRTRRQKMTPRTKRSVASTCTDKPGQLFYTTTIDSRLLDVTFPAKLTITFSFRRCFFRDHFTEEEARTFFRLLSLNLPSLLYSLLPINTCLLISVAAPSSAPSCSLLDTDFKQDEVLDSPFGPPSGPIRLRSRR